MAFFYSSIPNNWYGFIKNNRFYLDAKSSGNYPVDHVSGYTLSELEAVLYGNPRSAKQWKDAVKRKFRHNKSEKCLNELFNNYGY